MSNIKQTRQAGMTTGNDQEIAVYNQLIDHGYNAKRNVRVDTGITGIDKEADVILGPISSPRVIIESKYISRSKHAREKAYQLSCASKMWKERLDTKTIAVLSGSFTDGSLAVCGWGVDCVIHEANPQNNDWFLGELLRAIP